ncbi:MAG: RHS repeat-associated core domain-containing protein [Nitrospira sp.]|nr:RHS repeat-associated core domain-containing protein [Nitrospira sp.]
MNANATGVDATISRLSQIDYDGSALEEYQYLGLGTTVRRSQASGLRQTIWETGATSDSGDVYNGFDRFGRVVNLLWETTGGTDRAHFNYGYDRDGNRLYRTNELNHNCDELYHASGKTTDTDRYDRLNQLTGSVRGTLSHSNSDGVLDTVSAAARTQSWTFDGLGNFPTVTTNSATQTRTHNIQNQLLTLVDGSTTTTLDYDDNGNMIVGENGVELGYDAWNRLTKYASTTYFRYDATGRRSLVIYSNPSTGTHYRNLYYDTGWQLIEERGTTTGATRNQYVWTPAYIDGLVVKLTDSAGDGTYETRHYALTDANWNVTAITDSSGVVLERFISDPYGRFDVYNADWSTLQPSGSAYAWDYFHQGGRYDYATGLFHYRHRDYSPTLMRWVGMDPIGCQGGCNLYEAYYNSPIVKIDPQGLQPPPPVFVVPPPAWVPIAGGVIFGGSGVGLGYGISKRCGLGEWLGDKIVDVFYPPEPKPEPPKPPGGGGSTKDPPKKRVDVDPDSPCDFYYLWCSWGVTCTKGSPSWTRNVRDCEKCWSECKKTGSWSFSSCAIGKIKRGQQPPRFPGPKDYWKPVYPDRKDDGTWNCQP